MSPFTVMVVTDSPDYSEIEAALLPYHEYERTGIEEYLEEVDDTEDYRNRYETCTYEAVRFPNGEIYHRHDDKLYSPIDEETYNELRSGDSEIYTDPERKSNGCRAIKKSLLANCEIIQAKYSDTMTFRKFIADNIGEDEIVKESDINGKHCFAIEDESGNIIKIARITNPNSKWDWWVIGGRWSNYWSLKPGAVGYCGESLGAPEKSEEGIEKADCARKSGIDFESMMAKRLSEKLADYKRFHEILNGREIFSFSTMIARHGDHDEARAAYWAQEAMQDLRRADLFFKIDDFILSEEEFIKKVETDSFVTFAVLYNGEWHESGSMGWFGMVSNENEDWSAVFKKMLAAIPDDKYLTIVDCHV